MGMAIPVSAESPGSARVDTIGAAAIMEDRINKWCSLRDSNSCSRRERAVSEARARRERYPAGRASIAELTSPAMPETVSAPRHLRQVTFRTDVCGCISA